MKEVLRSIDGVSLFPVIAFLIFFLFFLGLLVYVFRLRKQEVSEMATIPLDDQPFNSASINDQSIKQ